MKVKNGVPQSNIISYYNVPDEDLSILGKEPVEKIIKAILNYYQRSVFTQMFPGDNISLILDNVNLEYLSYLKDITGKVITNDNFISIKGKSISKIAEFIPNNENRTLLPFICVKTAQELGQILNNKGIYMPNLGKEEEVELANSKIFLRDNFGDKFMVKGKILNVKDKNFRNSLEYIFKVNEQKGIGTIVRIPRSASGLGIRILKKEANSNGEITIDDLVDLLNYHLQEIDYLLVENMLPKNSFTSPNVVGYIHSDGKVDIFGATDQLLINNVHQGNIYKPENEKIYSYLKKISIEILKQYYKKLNVIGYFGVDFLLLEENKLDNTNKYFSHNFKAKFEIDGKTYYAPVVEINFRINGGMPLAWTQNLKNINTDGKVVTIINTLEIKNIGCIISKLREEKLLIDNGSDKRATGVLPVTILPGKFQYIIISNSIEEMKEINNKLKNLLG